MNKESLLKASVVFMCVGTGIIGTTPILMVLRMNTFSQTLGLFCIGLVFAAVGSSLRKIYYMMKNRGK